MSSTRLGPSTKGTEVGGYITWQHGQGEKGLGAGDIKTGNNRSRGALGSVCHVLKEETSSHQGGTDRRRT